MIFKKPDTDNALDTQWHKDSETRAAIENELADLETEALPIEKLDELERTSWYGKWNKKMKRLNKDLVKKYPDLVELTSVPFEELISRYRYSTTEDLEDVSERIKVMQSEYETRMDTLVAEMPTPFRVLFLAIAKVFVKRTWGNEVAEEMEKEGTL